MAQEAETNVASRVDATQSSQPEPMTVGARLKAAREAAQLTQDDIAQALKFSPRQIAALEADDYDALPGATIVRGFVRNYAKLLKLDAAPLLQQLEATLPRGPSEVRPPDNMGVASEPQGLRLASSLLRVALVLFLAALLLALWHFFGPAPQPVQTTTASTASSLQSPVKQPSPLAAGNPAPFPAAVPEEASATSSPPAPSAEPATPSLRLSFADRSWVEITDASKRILHSGENPPGSELQLTGQPPFDLVIGNAGKVTLTYNGQPIDLAPHTRAEVARLKLE